MDELLRYIEILFADYRHSPEARRCQSRLVHRFQARLEQKIASGMGAATALRQVQSELAAWAAAHEDSRLVYVSRCRQDCWEKALSRLIVLWVFSLPLIVVWRSAGAVICIACAVLMCLTALLALYGSYRVRSSVGFVHMGRMKRRLRRVWALWLVLAGAAFFILRANGQPTEALGSYGKALSLAPYYASLLTVVYPLILGDVWRSLRRHDVGQGGAAMTMVEPLTRAGR